MGTAGDFVRPAPGGSRVDRGGEFEGLAISREAEPPSLLPRHFSTESDAFCSSLSLRHVVRKAFILSLKYILTLIQNF